MKLRSIIIFLAILILSGCGFFQSSSENSQVNAETPNAEILHEILTEDVKFHSPFVWKPKDGKAITMQILLTVTQVFQNFRYVREIVRENQLLQ